MGERVQLTGVTKRYHETHALRELTVSVEAGEVFSLLGPSGSGKTTTLMLLAGIVAPTSGRIEIGGVDVTGLPPYRRNIGVVFQNYALFPHMSVFENVAFPLRRRGVRRPQLGADVERALELVRLPGLGRRYVHQLSGGQQQRVALARALVFKPPLLLMDEPLGALDKKLREQMQIEIKQITRAVGITAIYVTHDQEEALTLSDRIAILRGGRLEQVGTPEDLYHAPATRFVADFIGSTNLLEGKVVETVGGGPRVRCSEGFDFALSPGAAVPPGGVAVSIRPECIRIRHVSSDPGPGEGSMNRTPGTISDRIFVGGLVKYRVAVGGQQLLVHAGNDGMVAKLREGDAVIVAWQPEDGRLVAEGPSPTA